MWGMNLFKAKDPKFVEFCQHKKTIKKHLRNKALEDDFCELVRLAVKRLDSLYNMNISAEVLINLVEMFKTLISTIESYNKMDYDTKVKEFSISSPEKVEMYKGLRTSYLKRIQNIVAKLDDVILIWDKAVHDKSEIGENVIQCVMEIIKDHADSFVDTEKRNTEIITTALNEMGLTELEEKYSNTDDTPQTLENVTQQDTVCDKPPTVPCDECSIGGLKNKHLCKICGLSLVSHKCCFCEFIDTYNVNIPIMKQEDILVHNEIAEKKFAIATDINNFIIDGYTLTNYVGKSSIVVIPSGIRIIAGNCFKGMNISKVKIATDVEYLGNVKEDNNGAFEFCRELTDVYFEEGSKLSFIGKYTFNGCSKLKSINGLPQRCFVINPHAFATCNLDAPTLDAISKFANVDSNWDN